MPFGRGWPPTPGRCVWAAGRGPGDVIPLADIDLPDLKLGQIEAVAAYIFLFFFLRDFGLKPWAVRTLALAITSFEEDR